MTDYDVGETSRLLGVSERTVRRWLREGRIAGYKVGGRIRIPERAAREAVAPYGEPAGDAPVVGAPGSDTAPDPVVAWLTDPARAAEALRRRRLAAARRMDEIRAMSRPPRDETETAEALVRAVRDEQDERIDRVHGWNRS